jgi:MoaA/NifB/PqqE/SkfB family radical SAM enzyme
MSNVNILPSIDEMIDFSTYGTGSDINNNNKGFFNNLEKLKKYKLAPRYFSAPLFLMWEITSKCSLNCIHCYNESPRKVDELSHEEAMKIAKEIVNLNIFSICLTGGEPYLREDFFEIARFLKVSGVPISTVTNGWSVNEEIAHEYAKYFSHIQVSIDGGNAEIHDKIRGRKDSFNRAINAVKLFKKCGIDKVAIGYSLNNYNRDSFFELVGICKKIGADKLRVQPVVLTGNAVKIPEIEASEDDCFQIKKYIKDYNDTPECNNKLEVEWGEPLPHVSSSVKVGFAISLRITAEGLFSISPYLPFIMGNAKRMTIKETWDKGLRTVWKLPIVRENVKYIKNNKDVMNLNKKFNFKYFDISDNKEL